MAYIPDTYKVLPHRDLIDCSGHRLGRYDYEHVPCGMPLTRAQVAEANWCPHCAATINKAAKRRGERHRQEGDQR
jgi:hypothetical protein